jgi:hypothetical protein
MAKAGPVTQWKKGGNRLNPNPHGLSKDKLWRDAIRKQAMRKVDDPKNPNAKQIRQLDLVAGKLVKMAINGDIAAISEFGNRLDGKATQEVTGTVDVGNSLLQFLQYMQSQDARVIDGEAIEAEPLAVEDHAESAQKVGKTGL